MASGVSSRHIAEAIKAKYTGDQWRVWFEVSQSTGAYSGRRADAVVMNIWPSKGFQIHVFEIKVTRSDFKKEAEDPEKWKAVGKYADFFWLACPHGLVAKEEVPQAWGLMELGKAGLRIKKQAPELMDKTPLSPGFVASILRSGKDLTEAEIQRRAEEASADRIERAREHERERYDRLLNAQKEKADRLEEWKRGFEASFGTSLNIHWSPEQMAARLTLASRLERDAFLPLANQAKALASLIESMGEVT